MRKLFGIAVIALCIVALAPQIARASDITPDAVLQLMNAYRAMHGLDPLTLDPRLTKVADARMEDMEEQGYWDHHAPDGSSPFVLFPRFGYDYRAAGENLAKGFETTEVLVSAWMESPGHRANILGVNYRNVGIAIIDGETTRRAVGKSIVVVFGAEKVEHIVVVK